MPSGQKTPLDEHHIEAIPVADEVEIAGRPSSAASSHSGVPSEHGDMDEDGLTQEPVSSEADQVKSELSYTVLLYLC
jgi:hypothetical protein